MISNEIKIKISSDFVFYKYLLIHAKYIATHPPPCLAFPFLGSKIKYGHILWPNLGEPSTGWIPKGILNLPFGIIEKCADRQSYQYVFGMDK